MIELCLSAPVGVLHTFAHSMWVSPVAHNLHVIRVGNVDISNFSGRLKFKSKPCSIKFDFSSCIERIDHIYVHYHNFHCPAHCNFKMGKVHCTGFYIVPCASFDFVTLANVPCASFGFVTLANVPLEWAASFGFALCSVQRIVDCKPQMCRIVFGALLCRALQTVPLRSADGILFCIFVYLCVCVFAYCRICICVIAYWCICSLYCAAHRMLHPWDGQMVSSGRRMRAIVEGKQENKTDLSRKRPPDFLRPNICGFPQVQLHINCHQWWTCSRNPLPTTLHNQKSEK